MTEEIKKSLDIAIEDKRREIAQLKMELLQLVRSRDNLVRKIKPRRTGRPSKTDDKDYNIVRMEDVLKVLQSHPMAMKLDEIVTRYQVIFGVKPRSMNVSARLSSLKRAGKINNNENGEWYVR